jgi:hypothetical protein
MIKESSKESVLFLKKKNQKTFSFKVVNGDAGVRQSAKVFASFFKKKRFLPVYSEPK